MESVFQKPVTINEDSIFRHKRTRLVHSKLMPLIQDYPFTHTKIYKTYCQYVLNEISDMESTVVRQCSIAGLLDGQMDHWNNLALQALAFYDSKKISMRRGLVAISSLNEDNTHHKFCKPDECATNHLDHFLGEVDSWTLIVPEKLLALSSTAVLFNTVNITQYYKMTMGIHAHDEFKSIVIPYHIENE